MQRDRREFLRLGGSMAAAALSAPAAALAPEVVPSRWLAKGGYGPLRPARDETTGLMLLDLPEGFRYRSLGWAGDPMDDGRPTPGRHDGMAVIRSDGDIATVIRNHEVVNDRGSFGPEAISYDTAAGGGTSTFEFDLRSGEMRSCRISLAGTLQNCCGGPTPWESWLSCEEIVVNPDFVVVQGGRRREVRLQQRHGYVFEVPASDVASARPLTAMGQFAHEAVAVDPRDGIVYETEDHKPVAGFYRFIPDQPGDLAAGGRLQMLRVPGRPDLRQGVEADWPMDVTWVDIDEPERGHSPGTQDMAGVVRQGLAQGASAFTRLEGCWYADGQVFFSSTSGGDAGRGQIFRLDPQQQTLTLVYESPDRETLDYPDNLTVSPNGCVLICEDGSREGQMLMGLSPDGGVFPVARNAVELDGEYRGFSGDFRGSEWCGACFTPDGRWLLANIQRPGITVAITGPWERGSL